MKPGVYGGQPMNKEMPTWLYVDTIRAAIKLAHEPGYSDLFHRVFAEYAVALIMSYRVDDYFAVLVEAKR